MGFQVGPAEIVGGDRVFEVKLNVDLLKYAAVIQSAGENNQVDVPGGAGEAAWGLTQESVDYSGGQHHVIVRCVGMSKAIALDGNIVAGGLLQIGDTSGRLTTASTEDYLVARALEPSTALGDIITVMLLPGGVLTPA